MVFIGCVDIFVWFDIDNEFVFGLFFFDLLEVVDDFVEFFVGEDVEFVEGFGVGDGVVDIGFVEYFVKGKGFIELEY